LLQEQLTALWAGLGAGQTLLLFCCLPSSLQTLSELLVDMPQSTQPTHLEALPLLLLGMERVCWQAQQLEQGCDSPQR
jgi:hypothetical protein